jgi:uncharacterized membrane protein (DUF2068 family)
MGIKEIQIHMYLSSGVRVVAVFEAAKGILILLAGFGLLSIVHQNAQQVAEDIVRHFHLNPASRYPRIFIDVAGNISDSQLWLMAGFALAYAGIRLVEAYGLWRERRWAEWLAVLSAVIYVPIEIYEVLSEISWIKVTTLTINTCIVVYMSYALKQPPRNSGDSVSS